MPFDEGHGGGGGHGNDPGHDPEKIAHIVDAVKLQLAVNIEMNGVCQLCTRLNVITHLTKDVIRNIRRARSEGREDDANLGVESIRGMLDIIEKELAE